MNENVKTIGYWRTKKEDTEDPLPWPEENSDNSVLTQNEIIRKLHDRLIHDDLVSYRGISTCRLCGKANGSRELQIAHEGVRYRIPQGYLHYLTVHKVKADPILLKIL